MPWTCTHKSAPSIPPPVSIPVPWSQIVLSASRISSRRPIACSMFFIIPPLRVVLRESLLQLRVAWIWDLAADRNERSRGRKEFAVVALAIELACLRYRRFREATQSLEKVVKHQFCVMLRKVRPPIMQAQPSQVANHLLPRYRRGSPARNRLNVHHL